MARDTKKASAKIGRLKLKKETVRDLNVGESAKKVKGGVPRTATCN